MADGTPDYIYMTYDADREVSAISLHIETTNKSAATLDIGHISNGTYVVDSTFTVNNNTNFVEWLDNYNGYIVVRVTGLIKYCYCVNATKDGQTQHYRQQPILERIAYVPNLTYFCTQYSTNSWITYTLERDKVGNGTDTALTSLYYAWAYAYQLQSLDITNLRTPNVTSMLATFYVNRKLRELDLRHLDVSKVTTLSGTFYECRGLISINLTGWNTEKITNFSSTFSYCYSLKHIYGLENFNTEKATTFNAMFNRCYSIEALPVSNFKTFELS